MTISQTTASVCSIASIKSSSRATDKLSRLKDIYLPGTDCGIKTQVSLSGCTSYRVGGPAEYYTAPRSLESLKTSIEYARNYQLPITVIGSGSNLLISDRGISGLVLVTRHLRYSKFDPETGQLSVAAGESIPSLAWEAAGLGWRGLEWSVGIPGTIGGAVVMNAGAHASSIADILLSVQVLSPDGTLEALTPKQLGYRYRTSNLQGSNRIVTQAVFQLQPGADPAELLAITKEYKRHRLSTQPYDKPSCGSVFRNPNPHGAGWLIEQTGLKGFQIGKAQVAQRHANFIVNCGGATAGDIFRLIRHIQYKVQEQWSIWLEPEVKMIGEFSAIS
ncbi:UDP-N-acetylenolpyruvoylglucosamine reductase [Richelia intracellularis HH01]|uniref:UDP-N-acetylenolpyruvoylglucosamine reductase n=1 Tax=Richelia intracellularis HH01 TaxID=1165094 RepID=M1WX38_9NOST|nr:UDP-N-acetylmuramate dehydrogenase [Richelia intracellularis]CCH66162.1 UDP-N-acetylenolpyruvoylglucosamine reductase [Richelia intracellularis HH01]